MEVKGSHTKNSEKYINRKCIFIKNKKMSKSILIMVFCLGLYIIHICEMESFDFAKRIKYEASAEVIQDMNNQILFWLIGIFVFVLTIAIMTYIMSSYEWEQPKKENLVKKVKEHLNWSRSFLLLNGITIDHGTLSPIVYTFGIGGIGFIFSLYSLYIFYRFFRMGPCIGTVVRVITDTLVRVEWVSGNEPVNGSIVYIFPKGIVWGSPKEEYGGVLHNRVYLYMNNPASRHVGDLVYAGQYD